MIIFISGTGTNIGKTYINMRLNALLMGRGYNIISIKPIETGVEANSACSDFLGSASAHSLQRTPSASHSFASHNPKNSSTILEFADSANLCHSNIVPQDALLHAQNQSAKKDIKDICFYIFALPSAPFVADSQGEIDLDFLKRKIFALEKECDILMIEGAGGLFVPIKKDYFFIDLIKDLGGESLESIESKGESKALKSHKSHESPESKSHESPESKPHESRKCLCALISNDKLGCIDAILSHREALERRNIEFISIVNVFDESQFLQISYPFLRDLERNFIFQTQEREILDFIAKFINS